MRLIENRLYLTFDEMVDCGVSENTLKHAKMRGVNCWEFVEDPKDKRKVLVSYEGLKDMYKKLVWERFGDPYVLVAKQPILDLVINDPQANIFYKGFRYDGNNMLTREVVDKYTRAASWLNMLNEYGEEYRFIKKELGLTVPEFYAGVSSLVKQEIANGQSDTYSGVNMLPSRFPTAYQRIKEKVKKYNEEGYGSLISPMYGNKIAAKVGKTEDGFDEQQYREQIAVIRHAAGQHVNWDAAQVTEVVNAIFEQNGWPKLKRSSVYKIMNEHSALLTPARQGKRAYDSKIAMQIQRTRPQFPTYYWTLDGWTVELLYKKPAHAPQPPGRTNQYGGPKGGAASAQDRTTYHNRLVMVVVLDAMNNYPVGYAIGERETPELIREANRNAILHMKELFGDHYAPNQIQSDNYALKNLTPFYQAMAHLHTPAAVGNAKAKVIEPYFKDLNKNYCQKLANWGGFGITSSKKNQVNAEKLNMIKHQFPDKEGVTLQIEQMMERERRLKVDEYIAKWEVMPAEHKRVMSLEDRLEVFGQVMGGAISIGDKGIRKQINGELVTFDCFDLRFREYMHLPWTIKCEPEDMSHALATSPDGKMKFVLERKRDLPMSVIETTEEDTAYRKRVGDYNKEAKQHVIDTYHEDAEIVEEIFNRNPLELTDDNEAALKLMFTVKGQQKEGLQDAKGLVESQKSKVKTQKRLEGPVDDGFAEKNRAYLLSKVDLDEYS